MLNTAMITVYAVHQSENSVAGMSINQSRTGVQFTRGR
jgi:hypothetical protein